MASTALLDIDMAGVDFDAAHVELLRAKVERNGPQPVSNTRRRATADWGNFVDDCIRAFQRGLYEQAARLDALEAGAGDYLPRDGSEVMSGSLDMDGNDITTVALLETTSLSVGGGPAFTSVTSFAASLLDDADAATARATLGVSTVASSGVIVLARSTTPQDVSNTTTPTAVLSYAIPAATLATSRLLHAFVGFTYLNDSAGVRIFTIEIELDGVLLWSDGSNSNSASSSVTAGHLEFWISPESNTVVHLSGNLRQHATNAPTTGLGAADNTGMRMDAAISTVPAGVTIGSLASGSRTLVVRVTHPAATATQTFRRTMYSVTLEP